VKILTIEITGNMAGALYMIRNAPRYVQTIKATEYNEGHPARLRLLPEVKRFPVSSHYVCHDRISGKKIYILFYAGWHYDDLKRKKIPFRTFAGDLGKLFLSFLLLVYSSLHESLLFVP
jgi:hypothetical protein